MGSACLSRRKKRSYEEDKEEEEEEEEEEKVPETLYKTKTEVNEYAIRVLPFKSLG